MFYKPLAERAYCLKETTRGNENMCQIMEELNNKASKIAKKKESLRIASSLLKESGIPIEKNAKCCDLTLEEVKELANENQNH